MQECRKFFRGFVEFFDDDYPFLRRHLNYDRTFAIGFPEKGSKLENVEDIKKCIAKLVRDPDYFEKRIRPVWAIFEHILQRKKSQRILSRIELSKINGHLSEELQMSEKEITKMLCFLHRVGTLLYFNEESLYETIILDIEWFVNAFNLIIDFRVDIRESDDKRERFKVTGLLDDTDLTSLWINANEEYIFHKKKIVSYMERLGLLAKCEPGNKLCYYFPSMSKSRFDDKNFGKEYTKSSILCFQYNEKGELPVFLFYGTVLKCMQIPKWSALQAHHKLCLYENAACFSFQHLIVVICLCKFQIQVQVWVPTNENIDLNLLGEIQQSIEKIIGEYKGYSYTVGYKCQNGSLNTENDSSFIARKEFPVSKRICDKCKINKKHYVENKVCWVGT